MPDSPSILACLQRHAKYSPHRDAIVSEDYRLSYADLYRAVTEQAALFHDAGISGDTLVGISCPDEVLHIIMCLSSLYVGATSYTIPGYEQGVSQSDLQEHYRSIREVDSSLAIDPLRLRGGEDAGIHPEEDGYILFSTSGTAGKAKLVIHSGANIVAQAHRHIGSAGERFACLASVEHNFSKRHRLYCIARGATNIFLSSDKDCWVEQCMSSRLNVLHVSAYQAQEMLSMSGIERLAGIKLKIGGSHVTASLRKQIKKEITPNLYAGYGTTETGAIAFSSPADPVSTESVGVPLDGIDVRIVHPENLVADSKEPGELVIRCKGMFHGYLGRGDLYQSRVVDGWFHTGDMGYLDGQGRIHLCGRSDDVFLFNSINIYPQELESDILGFGCIADVAVIAKPSPTHGGIPVALVVVQKNSDFSLSKLKRYMHQRAGIRHPRQYVVVEEIPRNRSGKVLRHQAVDLSNKIDSLRATFCDELGDVTALNDVFPDNLDNFKNGLEDIDLRTLDMDSLMRMELLVFIETRFDTVIPAQELYGCRYLSEIITRIAASNSGKSDNEYSHQQAHKIKPPVFGSDDDSRYDAGLVRRFQRIFRHCHTVTHLNHVLRLYEDRLTPAEFNVLLHSHSNHELIPQDTAGKLLHALNSWFHGMEKMLLTSGKSEPEPYTLVKLRPAVWLFTGSGKSTEKTLVVCFSEQGLRRITIPNTLLLQYADASRYDILIIGEPRWQGYMQGIPFVGEDEIEVIQWIKAHEALSCYRRIRTIGCSAGAYPAILAGYYLKAELAISAGGRFHSTRRYPALVWRRIKSVFIARLNGGCPGIIFSYSIDSRRDRKFALIMSWITGGARTPIEDAEARVGHQFFEDLLRKEKLKAFFRQTIFSGNG